jgi:outer membrane autotransporter protein
MPSALALALAGALAVPGVAGAADWTGAVSNNWFTAGNWNTAVVPTAADGVIINAFNKTAIVSGAAAFANNVNIAVSTSGALAILNGGSLTTAYANMANLAGSSGTALVDGAGSTWTMAGNQANLIVGIGGSGSVVIRNGGKVSNSLLGQLGAQAGASGMVSVNGAGSSWTTGTLAVGNGGTGTLEISGGGTVNNGNATLGNSPASAGTATVAGVGSTWNNSGKLTLGNLGNGTVAVLSGGTLNVAQDTSIAMAASSASAMLVDGVGSQWINSGAVNVGVGGAGTLTVQNAGMALADDYLLVGVNAGAGGTLNILSGGSLTTQLGDLGRNAGSTGTANVDGPGSRWIANSPLGGNFVIGDRGAGKLTISGGGQSLADNIIVLALHPDSVGGAIVDGQNSTFAAAKDFYVGDGGNGALTLVNGGLAYSGTLVRIADKSTSVGALNIGAAVGAPAAAPGVLVAPAIIFGAGAGSLNFNHTDLGTSYNFSTTLVGAGTLNHNAGWTNLTEDSSLFTGPTHVNGGRLVVYGGMSNSLFDVNNGGTLGGNGYVGGTLVNAGGTVAPGTTSTGTLNVVGDIKFSADSFYQVDANSGGFSDKILATTATLRGGTVQVVASPKGAAYGPSTSYNILSTTGGVIGQFAGVSSNLAFLTPSLSYDPNNVYLKLTRNHATFASVGANALQRSTAAGVESLARVESTASPVYQAVVTLSAPQARAAFDQLSGEVHASTRGVQLENSHLTRDVSLERLRIAGNEDTGNDGGGASEDGSSAPRLLRSLREPSFWSRAMGSWGTMDGNGAATVKRDSAGFMLGVDTRVGEEGRFGLMGGYGSSSFDVNTRSASGNSDNYTVGAYGGTRWGDLALRGGVAYTWQDVSTRRTVAFTGFTDSLAADYKANTTQLFAELGWRIKREQSEFEPFVNLSHVNVSSDGFTERGGAASLTSASSSSGVTFSTLGVRASTLLSSGGTDVTARGSLGWRHAFGDTSPTTEAAFGGSSAFEMTGTPVAKSVGVIEAGLDFKLSNTATLGVTYGGQFGSGLKEHSARVQLHVAF